MQNLKWKNKGHEFDNIYETLRKKSKFYLFGGGDYGRLFFDVVNNEIEILGFIDSDKSKQGSLIKGVPVFAPESIEIDETTAIIVTASQFARVEIFAVLDKLDYKKNIDYYILEVFLSVYFAYLHNKVYFTNVSMLPSTKCNLNCECCLNFNPYAKNPDVRPIEAVKSDIDLFFGAVDKVMLFHVSGGETFLYKNVVDVITYLSENYRGRIGALRLITNGTIVPSDEVFQRLSTCDFDIIVDDYRDAVPHFAKNFDKLISKLEKFNITYTVNKDDFWIDLAPTKTDNSSFTEQQLIDYFDGCSQSWQELRDGKLYSCNYDGYATVAGINPQQDEEVYDLRTHTKEKLKELVEFRLGYNGKGYTNLCKHCRGFREENSVICEPAKQSEAIIFKGDNE